MTSDEGKTGPATARHESAFGGEAAVRVAGGPVVRRRLAWRVAEAAIVLFCLLTAHQMVWVLFNIQIKDEARQFLSMRLGAPDFVIYLKPQDPLGGKELGTVSVPMTYLALPTGESYRLRGQAYLYAETFFSRIGQQQFMQLTAFAPPRKWVVPRVNGNELSPAYSSGGKFRLTVGPLRHGINLVSATLREDAAGSGPPAEVSTHQVPVLYRPFPLPPKFAGVGLRDSQMVNVYGTADPLTTVHLKVSGKERSHELALEADEAGFFNASYLVPPGESLELRAAGGAEELQGDLADVLRLKRTAAGELAAEPAPSPARHISLAIAEDNTYRADFSVTLPEQSAVFDWVSKKQTSPRELIEKVFGLRYPYPFEGASGEPPVIAEGRIQFSVNGKIPPEGLRFQLNHGMAPPLIFAGDQVRLTTKQPGRVRFEAQPKQADETTWVWSGPYEHAGPFEANLFRLMPVTTGAAADGAPPGAGAVPAPDGTPAAENRLSNLGDLLREIERQVPNSFGRIFFALLTAIPYLYALWLLWPPGAGYRGRLAAATASLLIFHLTIQTLPVFTSIFEILTGFTSHFNEETLDVGGRSHPLRTVTETLSLIGAMYPFLIIGVIILLRPIYGSYRLRPPAPTRARRFVWFSLRWLVLWPLVILVPAALFVGLVYLKWSAGSHSPFQREEAEPFSWQFLQIAAAFLGAALLCFWFFLFWLIRVGLGRRVGPLPVVAASWAMIFFPLVPPLLETLAGLARYFVVTTLDVYPFFIPRHVDSLLWFLIIPLVGTLLLYRVTYIALRLASHRPGIRLIRAGRSRWVVVPLFFLLSLPMAYIINASREQEADMWAALNNLAYRIDDLLPYVLLLGLLVYLRKLNRADDFDLPDEARRVGVLLFAFYLTGRSANLLFIPVPFFLGWLVFARGVLAPRPPPRAAGRANLRKLADRLLNYRQAVSLSHDLQRNLEKKYSQGEIGLADFRTKTGEGEKNLAAARRALHPHGPSGSRQVLFAHGPEAGPWANARVAVAYGLFISIPFQISTLTSIFAGSRFGTYPILRVLSDVLFSVSYWILAAFLFGYFFHLIKGRDGFQKALVYSAALIVPTIPLRVVQAQPLLGKSHVIEVVQVLAFVLVLALVAFDLRRLNNLGYAWRDLLRVHGLTTISAYVSSILLTTAASVGGKDLLKMFWDFFASR
jgi:hypothetical protein